MPSEKADIFVLARFGDFEKFKNHFNLDDIHKKEYGHSLLHQSIAGRQFEISLFLIDNGIDINMTDEDGFTSLHYIAIYPNLTVAKEILNRGGDINIRNKYGNSALMTAIVECKGRYYDLVELFLQYNPDTTLKNNTGLTPIELAKKRGYEKLINMLEK
ncbi:ankyrin repeat domain-containing protein [Neobacillus sp. NPDC097160]|uniref:ankyrin repeat domain-containing protein n=1 Tax=Neobacillus sp. NPDC097160 TaxID=3364298 RepID=UPI003823BD65